MPESSTYCLCLFWGSLRFLFGPYPELLNLNNNAPLPEEQLSTPETVASFLEQIGPQGRELYIQFQFLDLLNPLIIVTFLLLTMAWLLKQRGEGSVLRFVLLVPLLILVAELWENTLLALAGASYPQSGSGIASVGLATVLKFLGLGLSLSLVLLLGILVLLQRRRGQQNAV